MFICFSIIFSSTGFAWNNSHSYSLIQPRDVLLVDTGISTSYSNQFYDNAQTRMTFSDLYYLDSELYFSFQYGLTRSFTIGFYFPYRYRQSGGSGTIQTWGLGDIDFNATYELYHSPNGKMENGFVFSTQFPSGNTRALNDNGSLELPLGNGQYEWTIGFHNRFHVAHRFHITCDIDYRYRMEAIAEYLVITLVDQTYMIDIANSTIDFGDKLTALTGIHVDLFDQFSIGSNFLAAYQFKTMIDGAPISYISTSTDSTISSDDSDGFIIYALPSLRYTISNEMAVHVDSQIPLYGWRYPVVSLADVVSLVPKYALQVGFELRFK